MYKMLSHLFLSGEEEEECQFHRCVEKTVSIRDSSSFPQVSSVDPLPF